MRSASGRSTAAPDYEEILDDSDIDAVLIASRNQHHAAQSLQALRAGKHVFVEKPMALTDAECRRSFERGGTNGQAAYCRIQSPLCTLLSRVKQALSRRSSPAVVTCRINSPGFPAAIGWPILSIGGAILGEACHFVDLMYWLLDAEPVECIGVFAANRQG